MFNDEFKLVAGTVFPSDEETIQVEEDVVYNGAHRYKFQNCLGFKDGDTVYDNTTQEIQFVKIETDGSITPGLQSEQIVIALLDRQRKLHRRFPSVYNEQMITALEEYLVAAENRVRDRLNRGVMGTLKN